MRRMLLPLLALFLGASSLQAQTANQDPSPDSSRAQEIRELRGELARIAARLDALERTDTVSAPAGTAPATAAATPAPSSLSLGAPPAPPALPPPAVTASAPRTVAPPVAAAVSPAPASAQAEVNKPSIIPINLPGGATLNYTFDGYYEYNFNQPPGRVNDLRAYDVLSNTFSINQAAVLFALDPDTDKGRRYGLRLDLQYGQATDTLQGNPTNEPRPGIYQNIFQAYGTYVFPVAKGWNVDFGKFASSLGAEGNYTKDQLNYTRSFYFYYLPFYHVGLRTSFHVNDKLALNYWIVNGTNQSEPTNGYKDELFGFTLTPTKSITWTSNYYLGQEHPDTAQSTTCTYPVQPGLCEVPISPAPNGKIHIFDNYVTWQATPKWTFTGEGDYVIQRQWANAAPGESSAPSHVSGGALYAAYQLNARASLAARSEYLSDRGGLFSGSNQALKEFTFTYKHNLHDGLDTFVEYRTDWSNVPYFQTHNYPALANHQTTATLGLVWWYGGKQGSW